ncbi:two component system sensor kinase [Chromobacterium amazonense]|uniref:two component system sensor kinase n=1 Tax=Chromobacterium amazonense TaxID=1382803 RepID=UPI003F7AFC0B
MKHFPWRTSLSFRLSLALSSAIFLFWLISTGVALFLDYKDTQASLLQRLETNTESRAEHQSAELWGVANDMHTLLEFWRNLPADAGVMPGGGKLLTARYISTGHHACDSPEKAARALAFVEAYGSGGVGAFLETFVLLPQGVALSDTNKGNLSEDHLQAILSLKNVPERAGLIWGQPTRGRNGRWRMLVAIHDKASGAILGMSFQLRKEFNEEPKEEWGSGGQLWLDENGAPLTPEPLNLPAMDWKRLPDCAAPFSQRMGDTRVICRQILPTHWRLVQMYPVGLITNRALSGLPKPLIVVLLLLLALVGLLYFVLQHSLGRTLAHYVRTISPQEEVSDQQRLPDGREDELGQIAQAYNRLLDAVQAQYAQLEAKVTERTQELEEARYRAEKASANKSEQVTSISHEIRTPLNGIVGALMLLNRSVCDANQHYLVDTALKCSGHLLEIINNLLDFSRIESGQMIVTVSRQDPLVLIDQAMLTVQVQALNKQLSLRSEVSAAFPETLFTDGLRLRQILINLLGNAVKFTHIGGVELRVWSAEGKAYFSVSDTGPGIPPEKQGEVFTAFRQLDSHVAGSGLGLPIARSLARLLGGDLCMASSEQGSCFQLELPLGEAVAAEPTDRGKVIAPERLHPQLLAWGYQPKAGVNEMLEAPELVYLPARLRQWLEPERTSSSGMDEGVMPASTWSLQVLVVDDVDTNRDIVGRMLRSQGNRIFVAAGGEEALALGRVHVFDLVLMDMRMPGMSGLETVARWRDESFGVLDPDCPIVALTANAQPGERERLLASGFDEYLTKPVSPAMLARAVDFAADKQLERGMELEPNLAFEQPVLSRDPALLQRLSTDLRHYYQLLGRSLVAQDKETSLDLLHTFKGLSGQAGLDLLCEAATHWEAQLQADMLPVQGEWEAFGRLIDTELRGALFGKGR